jgi:hypothetical protein
MKKSLSLFSILALTFAFSGNAFAQDVKASATIVQSISYPSSGKQDMNFGQIVADQISNDPTLDPTGSSSHDVGTSHQIGKLEIDASAGSSLNISFKTANGNKLENTDDNTKKLTFTPNYKGSSSSSPTTYDALSAGGSTGVTADGTSGKYYIFLGGNLDKSEVSGADDGTYEGTITVTADYQ